MASSTSGLQPVKFLQPFIQRFAMSATHCHYLSLKIYLFTWIHNTCFFVWEINSKWWMLIQLSRMYNCSEFCDRDLFNFFFISQTTGTNWLVKANVISSPSRLLHPGMHNNFENTLLRIFLAKKCTISELHSYNKLHSYNPYSLNLSFFKFFFLLVYCPVMLSLPCAPPLPFFVSLFFFSVL